LSEVVTDIVRTGPQSGRRENVFVNVFWPDDREDLAIDTRNTLSDASVLAHLKADTEFERSQMDWHRCNHDAAPVTSCPAREWVWPS
jgi:hypothetical protein